MIHIHKNRQSSKIFFASPVMRPAQPCPRFLPRGIHAARINYSGLVPAYHRSDTSKRVKPKKENKNVLIKIIPDFSAAESRYFLCSIFSSIPRLHLSRLSFVPLLRSASKYSAQSRPISFSTPPARSTAGSDPFEVLLSDSGLVLQPIRRRLALLIGMQLLSREF